MFETILSRISPTHRRKRRNRVLKEGYWKSDERAQTYAENVALTSVGMLSELAITQQIATGQVLDLGAGTGRFSRPLAESGLAVTAADISDAMLRTGLQMSQSPYQCVVTSALNPELPSAHYDTVISFWLMLHFAEWETILAQIVRLAKPGAMIAFEFPNRDHYDEVARIDRAKTDELTKQIGYESWLKEEEVRDSLERLGCSLLWTRPYDAFNENWIARFKLGEGYEAWKNQVSKLAYEDPICREQWRYFEATQLSKMHPAIGRKRLYVAQKATRPTVSFQEQVSEPSQSSPSFEPSRELFNAAFADYL